MEKILNSKILYSGQRFTVKELQIELEPGKIVHWEVVDKGSNSVAMVPVDNQGNVYLVEEYFAATNERALSLPKGMVEPGETNEDAALRELQEEIGMKGTPLYLVTMSVSPGYLTQKTILFLVTNLEQSKLEKEEEQYQETVKIPLSEAIQMIRRGEITEARTIGGITLSATILGSQIS